MYSRQVGVTKTQASSIHQSAPQHSMFPARSLGRSSVEQAPSPEREVTVDDRIKPNGPAGLRRREPSAGVSRDFSQIPVSSPDRVGQTRGRFLFSAPRQLGAIQPKLVVSQPNDPLEREADRVADQVVQSAEEPSVRGKARPEIRHQCAQCGSEICRKEDTAGGRPESGAPAIVDQLARHRSEGQPLPSKALRAMEVPFGYDFSGVRLHRDSEASEMNRQLNARAFTQRNHIFFGNGMFDTEGSSGRHLLAHELAHVVQQGHAPQRRSITPPVTAIGAAPIAPTIQRKAMWKGDGSVHQENNLAKIVLGQDTRVEAAQGIGWTYPKLNGTILNKDTDPQAVIRAPELKSDPNDSPGSVYVDNVLDNDGWFDETVLKPGPWKTSAKKQTVRNQFSQIFDPRMMAACNDTGNTTFQAAGDPNDKDMFDANRHHEDHHVADHQRIFKETIGAWDAKLQAAHDAKRKYPITAGHPAARLYQEMGGYPEQIARAYKKKAYEAGAAFHQTPKGAGPEPAKDAAVDRDCSECSVKYHNPG